MSVNDANPPASSPELTLWTVGYGAWPVAIRAEKLIAALKSQSVTRLVDVRLSPCASQLEPGNYGPKPWNLQSRGQGIASLTEAAGIAYEWMVELGNPQRHDPAMAILKAHLADERGDWPVHRGLTRLARRVREPNARIAVMCACARADECHRSVIAEALKRLRFNGELRIRHC